MGKIYQVMVHGLRGEKITIDLCNTEEQMKNMTVRQLREKIAEKLPDTAEQNYRSLLFTDKILEGDSTLLSDYGVQHMSVIHLVVRVPTLGEGPQTERQWSKGANCIPSFDVKPLRPIQADLDQVAVKQQFQKQLSEQQQLFQQQLSQQQQLFQEKLSQQQQLFQQQLSQQQQLFQQQLSQQQAQEKRFQGQQLFLQKQIKGFCYDGKPLDHTQADLDQMTEQQLPKQSAEQKKHPVSLKDLRLIHERRPVEDETVFLSHYLDKTKPRFDIQGIKKVHGRGVPPPEHQGIARKEAQRSPWFHRFLLGLRIPSESTSCPPVEKCYDLSDSRLKFVDREDDLDFLCEGFSSPRALMSCGHAVTPMSLTKWCLKQLEEGKSRFVCGLCDAVWTYEEVCRMALLTPEEKKHFERTMALNDPNTRNCPDCKSFVVRQNESDLCVCCSVCTLKKGRVYEFCWQCLREWKGPKPRSDRCGNDGCCNPALKTLKTCPDVVFGPLKETTTMCPSIRACPTCGSLLEHKLTNCKHLTCPQCKVKFCFVCLKTYVDCSKTSGLYKLCSSGVVPRQTSIPVWKK